MQVADDLHDLYHNPLYRYVFFFAAGTHLTASLYFRNTVSSLLHNIVYHATAAVVLGHTVLVVVEVVTQKE